MLLQYFIGQQGVVSSVAFITITDHYDQPKNVETIERTISGSQVHTEVFEARKTTPVKIINLDQTGQLVGSAGSIFLHTAVIFNMSAAMQYFKFYDKATTVVAASDVPKQIYPIDAGGIFRLAVLNGMDFTVGMWVRATAGSGDTDNTAPGNNIVNLGTRVGGT
jgi:hypothetical protein